MTNDLISREALEAKMSSLPKCDYFNCMLALQNAPAIDAVEVVYCKNCINLGIKDFAYGYCKYKMCGIIRPDDYCSFGKHRESEVSECVII